MNSRRSSKRLRKTVGETPTPRVLKKPKIDEDDSALPLPLSDNQKVSLSAVTCNHGNKDIRLADKLGTEPPSCRTTDHADAADTMSADQLSDGEDQADYNAKLMQNRKENAEFLSTLGINKDKENLFKKKKSTKPSKWPGNMNLVNKKPAPAPRRVSMRLQRIDPDGIPLPPPPELPQDDEMGRKPTGPLDAKDQVYVCPPGSEVMSFMTHIHMLSRSHSKVKVKVKNQVEDTRSYVKSLSNMQLIEERVMKVVPKRIFSIVMHPTHQCPLVAVGDKSGRLGLWDVSQGEKGVFTFEPHSRPIPHLDFPKENPGTLYSSSYDGTMRCLDVERGVFNEVYVTPEEDYTRLYGFSFLSSHSLVVAQGDGTLGFVDLRSNTVGAENVYPAHDRLVKSTSVHPIHAQYFVSSSNDCCVNLWDSRMMNKNKQHPLDTLRHGKSVDSAYFSPITGNHLLTTSMDNTIRIYDSSEVSKDIKEKKSIRHNNWTGRWLSNFRAAWHPSREDLFVVGSMQRPRQIEMFSVDGSMTKTFFGEDLGSVCSLNTFHPTRNILAGANSSGRIHVFM